MTFRVGFGAALPAAAQQAMQHLAPTAPTLVSSGDQIILPPSGSYTRDAINQLDAYRVMRRNTRMLSVQSAMKAQGLAGGPCWKPGDAAKNKPRGTPVIACAGWPNPSANTVENLPLIMYPLGTAVYLDVPFNVAEFIQAHTVAKASGNVGNFQLTRSYPPDAEQQIVAAKAIMDASINLLAGEVIYDVAGRPINASNFGLNTGLSVAGVKEALKRYGLTTAVPGYAFNPIPPTPDELTKPDGWKKYHARGGFFLSAAVVSGTAPIGGKVFQYLGQYCTCNGTPFGQPYQATASIMDVYLKATDAQWTMTLKPRDRSAFQAVVGTAFDAMTGFGKLVCLAAPMLTSIDKDILAAEVCTNTKTKKTCKKGEKDCKCTKPSTGQEMAVGLANFALNYWCGKAQGLINEQPPPIFDPNAQPPIVAPPASAPWWLIPLGAGVIGYLILRK